MILRPGHRPRAAHGLGLKSDQKCPGTGGHLGDHRSCAGGSCAGPPGDDLVAVAAVGIGRTLRRPRRRATCHAVPPADAADENARSQTLACSHAVEPFIRAPTPISAVSGRPITGQDGMCGPPGAADPPGVSAVGECAGVPAASRGNRGQRRVPGMARPRRATSRSRCLPSCCRAGSCTAGEPSAGGRGSRDGRARGRPRYA
jgi:hypothetical protein